MPSAKEKCCSYKNKCSHLIKGITYLTYKVLLKNLIGKALLQGNNGHREGICRKNKKSKAWSTQTQKSIHSHFFIKQICKDASAQCSQVGMRMQSPKGRS